MTDGAMWLRAIMLYPVKSLAGIRVDNWPVDGTGLRYDRQWMLADTDGQFLSQRQLPRLALIKTAIGPDWLQLSAPGLEPLRLPLAHADGQPMACRIWHDQCQALKVSTLADDWCGQFLQRRCHLLYLPAHSRRGVDPRYGQAGDRVAFADAFPFMLLSEASLAALNQAMAEPLTMDRFRPNLVVSGCDGYAEDRWRAIQIGGIRFRLPKPCARCLIPTINPATASTGKEPLTTLNRLRKWQNKVYFGQNAIHDNTGALSVGDAVTVVMSGPPQPPLAEPQHLASLN